MIAEVKELQQKAVAQLVHKLSQGQQAEITFKAPTGSGKSHMIAALMDQVIKENEHVVFIVSTLSKGDLAGQLYESFKKMICANPLLKIKPFLINSDASVEGNSFIPLEYNVYVLPRDLNKKNSRLIRDGVLVRFLEEVKTTSTIYLIKDECHQATKNLDALKHFFTTIVNVSATPNLKRGQFPDVEIKNSEAEQVYLIKRVERGKETDDLDTALQLFVDKKKQYQEKLGINPCFIIQISNSTNAKSELEEIVYPALNRFQGLNWVYITGDDDACNTNDNGLSELLPAKWKGYLKENSSTISVIIFKLMISEGWDIPRACMLYQIRNAHSEQLTEQVIGRVRRNPRLIDFEVLDEEAQKLACTAWIWGIMPLNSDMNIVNIANGYGIENQLQVASTRLNCRIDKASIEISSILDSIPDDRIVHDNIFALYKELNKQNQDIQTLCWEYSDSVYKWRRSIECIDEIKNKYKELICNYQESMEVLTPRPLSSVSLCFSHEHVFPIDDWVWNTLFTEDENSMNFFFDSEAERNWAIKLNSLSAYIYSVENAEGITRVLWGKNYQYNSEIKYEYYLDGIHSSYPDFIMKDRSGMIHIFEVKSVNRARNVQIDEDAYRKKVNAIKACYKAASAKTSYLFYIPICVGSRWRITKYENGNEFNITFEQFCNSFKQKFIRTTED